MSDLTGPSCSSQSQYNKKHVQNMGKHVQCMANALRHTLISYWSIKTNSGRSPALPGAIASTRTGRIIFEMSTQSG